MGSISAIHGITLSAWGFAGLTGNQLAQLIVDKTDKWLYDIGNHVYASAEEAKALGLDLDTLDKISPKGYQNVLYATGALYVVALVVCLILVRPSGKAAEAKAAKKAAAAK